MRVLAIEDNEQNLYLVRYLLEFSGHIVMAAQDGAQAFTILETIQPDIILLDIQLPDMDGHLVAQRLRQNHALDKVAIVVITSYAMPGDRERALTAGCDNYLTKPIDPDIFVTQIERFAAEKQHSLRTKP